MEVQREEGHGVRFIVIDGGRVDYAFHRKRGWVSVNWDYINPKELAPNPIGIRWELNEQEIEKIPIEDRMWLMEDAN